MKDLNGNNIDEIFLNFKQKLKDAEKVLIGIGTDCEFGAEFTGSTSEIEFKMYERLLNIDNSKDIEIYKTLYKNLYELVKDKDYYIISLCRDDVIYGIFDKDRVVCPCGSINRLQCVNNCNEELYDSSEFSSFLLKGELPNCTKCGEKLTFNTVYNDNYNEKAYMPQFEKYKKWLQTTINKQLLIAEIGVGMKFPSVIRLPFDKVCFYNQKASFYRVHSNLYQHTKENAERGISIIMNGKEFLEEL